jgi:hypothetical protein
MLKNLPNVKHIIINSRQIYIKWNYIQDSRLGTGVGAAGAAIKWKGSTTLHEKKASVIKSWKQSKNFKQIVKRGIEMLTVRINLNLFK